MTDSSLPRPNRPYDNTVPSMRVNWPLHEDLHLHTNASDGTLSPQALIQKVTTTQLQVIAVTDHDNVQGIEQAASAAQTSNLTLIPGVELSGELPTGAEAHIIGLFIRPDNPELNAAMTHLRNERLSAAKQVLATLNSLGMPLAWEDVISKGEGAIGRPHIARAMIEAGYVDSVQEAFDRYLADGKPARVAKVRLTGAQAIELVHGAGGVAILAHPRTVDSLEQAIPMLVDNGLDGIEVYAEKYQADYVEYYIALAEQYGLLKSGGSDYHAFGYKNEVGIGTCGPPPGTAKAFLEHARALHGSDAGSVVSGEL